MLSLVAHASRAYPPRTFDNAKRADLTAAFALDFSTAGERLTKKAAGEAYIALPLEKPAVENARALFARLRAIGVEKPVLNVAGNGIYSLAKAGWTQERLNALLLDVLTPVHSFWPLRQVVSGGQTGVDWAAGVAAHALGISVEMTLPRDFLQRGLDHLDAPQNPADLRARVLRESAALRA